MVTAVAAGGNSRSGDGTPAKTRASLRDTGGHRLVFQERLSRASYPSRATPHGAAVRRVKKRMTLRPAPPESGIRRGRHRFLGIARGSAATESSIARRSTEEGWPEAQTSSGRGERRRGASAHGTARRRRAVGYRSERALASVWSERSRARCRRLFPACCPWRTSTFRARPKSAFFAGPSGKNKYVLRRYGE